MASLPTTRGQAGGSSHVPALRSVCFQISPRVQQALIIGSPGRQRWAILGAAWAGSPSRAHAGLARPVCTGTALLTPGLALGVAGPFRESVHSKGPWSVG